MRRKALVSFACAAIAVVMCSAVANGAADQYYSTVGLQGNYQGGKLTGKIGDHFDARITYFIGWGHPPKGGSGSTIMTRSAINDPEYQVFASSLPAGLTFHEDTGTIEGTPRESGVWRITPAVRDKVKGEKMYRGNGYWFTQSTTYQERPGRSRKIP